MNLVQLSVNNPYPFQMTEGGQANFLSKKTGNILRVGVYGMMEEEKYALKKGKIKIGFVYQEPVIILIVDFAGILAIDCPFDARLYPSGDLDLHSITNQEQRLFVILHAIDIKTNILKVIRGFTLSPTFTLNFLSVVQDQLVSKADFERTLQTMYQSNITTLIKQAKMYECGK